MYYDSNNPMNVPTRANRPNFGNIKNAAPVGPKQDHDGVTAFFGGVFNATADTVNFAAVHGMTDTGPSSGPSPTLSAPTPPMQPAYNLRQRMGQFGLTQQFDFQPA